MPPSGAPGTLAIGTPLELLLLSDGSIWGSTSLADSSLHHPVLEGLSGMLGQPESRQEPEW